jgi:hypothetical protein
MLFGLDDPWPHLSSLGGSQRVMSLSRHQLPLWIDYIGDINTQLMYFSSSTTFGFLTNMSEKHKSTSPNAI